MGNLRIILLLFFYIYSSSERYLASTGLGAILGGGKNASVVANISAPAN